MKRELALLLALCLLGTALTGCGGAAGKTSAAATTAATTTAAATTAAATTAATTAAATTAAAAGAPVKEGGLYAYSVLGSTIKCKTNVFDYIQGDVLDLIGMAEDLGYHYRGSELFADAQRWQESGFHSADETMKVYLWGAQADSAGHKIFNQVCYDDGSQGEKSFGLSIKFARKDAGSGQTTYFVNEEGKYTVNLDQIVVFACLLENLPDSSALQSIYDRYGNEWPS